MAHKDALWLSLEPCAVVNSSPEHCELFDFTVLVYISASTCVLYMEKSFTG